MDHVIESQQFDRGILSKLFTLADALETKRDNCLNGKVLASLFYEPSTRTRLSFESAMIRLGGQVIGTENAREFSSAIKGETLEDTVRIISRYADVLVLRHSEAGASERASKFSSVPIINAGDGAGQHPTQALLDLYTIYRERGKIDGLKIAMIGDLKNGRTVRSLSYMLGKYDDVSITHVSPSELAIGEDIKNYLTEHGVGYVETEDLESVLGEVDTLYQTRIQKERFSDIVEYERFKGCYKIDLETVGKTKDGTFIMHPLPRVDEILQEVDDSPKAVYFKQAYYGLLIRMALLKMLLS